MGKVGTNHESGIARLQSLSRHLQTTSSQASIATRSAPIQSKSGINPQGTIERIHPPPGLNEDTFDHAVDVLATFFEKNPFMRCFQLDEATGPQTKKLSYAYLKPAMKHIITSFIEEENATLITIPGRDLTSAWSIQTAEKTECHTSFASPQQELLTLSSRSLNSSLPVGQRYIHAIIVGNRHPTRGVYSELMRTMSRLSDELGLPVYGEATNEKSRNVHMHLGFQIGGVFHVGQGTVSMDGMAEKGGSGEPHWPCLYRPNSAIRTA